MAAVPALLAAVAATADADDAMTSGDISSMLPSTSEEGRSIVRALEEVVDCAMGTPTGAASSRENPQDSLQGMPSASQAPSALGPSMPAASGGNIQYASALSEHTAPRPQGLGGAIPLEDVSRPSLEAIPLQDRAPASHRDQAQAIVPSTPPRAPRGAPDSDSPRTRTPQVPWRRRSRNFPRPLLLFLPFLWSTP